MAEATLHRKKKQKKRRSSEGVGNTQGHGGLYAAVTSALLGLVVGIGVLFILCAVLMATDDPTAFAGVLPYAAYLPMAAVAGVRCAKTSNLGGIPAGAVAGGFLLLILFGLGVCVPGTAADAAALSGAYKLIPPAAILLISCAAGYAVTHARPRVKRRFK